MIRSIIVCLLIFFILSTCDKKPQTSSYLDKEYWKNQALNDILPSWTLNATDTSQGAFFCTLDSNWQPTENTVKYPSMIARHLFGYSAAYLMSGDQKLLDIARNTKDYLLTHAWDNQYGGWYDALNANGSPQESDKSTFVQVYVITGLAMYYLVTHDAEVLDYVNQSNDLLEEKAWDHEWGGYYDVLGKDWAVENETKSFSSQLAPISGYLQYLYMATRDRKYLRQAERIADVVLDKMIDPETGWVLESFDRQWNYLPGREESEEINIGHNIEVAWTLLRLNLLNGRADYLVPGKHLADRLHQYGFNSENGFWVANTGNHQAEQHGNYTYWWIQAYGNMLELCLNKLYPNENYVSNFVRGATFWDTYFIDKEKGDTHFSVLGNGEVKDYQKANQYKSSYHSVEHSLLNFLYLGLWTNPEELTLYFNIASSNPGEVLYPVPVEIMNARISDVQINGEAYSSNESGEGAIILPALSHGKVIVTLN